MKSLFSFILILLLVLKANAQLDVRAVSAMKPVMMGQDLSAHVKLDTLTKMPHLFAVCPLNRLQGEVTIINGKIFKSTVDNNGKIRTDNTFEGTAPFMVYTQVEDWVSFPVKSAISSEEELQDLIEKIAKENGYNTQLAFPFMIKGLFDTVNFHIISKPLKEKKHNHELHSKAKKHYTESNIQGSLLGFFSKHHEGVFTHKGSFTHVHFLDEKESMTGHLEDILIKEREIVIWLPAKVQGLGNIEIKTLDTDFSKGRLKNEQIISVKDVAKLHGHLCDGLVLGFIGLREALFELFPDSVIDRTNVRIISKSSPCITDIAVYLTGGRYQFNTFYVNDTISYLYIVQRIDNGKTIGIKTVPGLVPPQIKEMGSLAVKGELDACGLDSLRNLEDEFILQLVHTNPEYLFIFSDITNFNWSSPLEKTFLKTDVLNKDKAVCK